jgi:hypothetical protein
MDTILYLILGFVVGAVAYRILLLILERYLVWRNRKLIALLQLADIMVIAQVEQVDDMFFVYSEKTQEFLAQGRTWEEIRTHFKSRFPGKVCAIDREMADIIPRLTPASE